MAHEISSCGSLCALRVFTVNGEPAAPEDFGMQYDNKPDEAEEYCCGDMRFFGKPSTPEVLARYGIDEAEYTAICSKLEEELSFGDCSLCL